ncbi:hypothetical protein RhiirA4_407421 [Rhizophagus irregularis]|uniref:Uncharacterized protein n=1 Tax=Rhizophagus irregularis TaxID=588596 RepID=A0A2I1GXQ6_9GLOM|nr:hypothetical protein RhiirA4_407421 [Rhizophagus irregularis]
MEMAFKEVAVVKSRALNRYLLRLSNALVEEIELEKHRLQTLESSKDIEIGMNVKWKELGEVVSYVVLIKYLGVQEDELVSFIIDHLRNKKPAEDLTKEMMMVC